MIENDRRLVDGLVLLAPAVHGDERGFFIETFRADTWAGQQTGLRLTAPNSSQGHDDGAEDDEWDDGRGVFLGSAMDVDLDASGRLLIAPELRTATGLERDVMLLGMGNHLELWDLKKHEEHEAQVMASEMPESLKNFSF